MLESREDTTARRVDPVIQGVGWAAFIVRDSRTSHPGP